MSDIETKLFELSVSTSRFSLYEFKFTNQTIERFADEPKNLNGEFKIFVYKANNHTSYGDYCITFHIIDNPIMYFSFDLRLGTYIYDNRIPKQRIFVKNNPSFKDGRVDFSIDDAIIFILDLIDSNENRMRVNLKYSGLKSITKLPIHDAMDFISFLNNQF